MKTRIFSSLGLLVLCAVFSTWGSKAWAVPCPGICLAGQYSCTGTGIFDDGDTKEDSFSTSGILEVFPPNVFSPAGAGWRFDVAGEPQFGLAVGSGDISALGVNTGEGDLDLVWLPGINAEFDFDGDKMAVPQNFNWVADTVVNGIAQEFTLQDIPGDDQVRVIWVLVCRLQ